LKDKKKRAHYDQMRAAGHNPFQQGAHAGPQGGWSYSGGGDANDFGLGDLFEEIFGRGGGGFGGGFGDVRGMGGRRRGGFRTRGADREASVTVSLQEAARGGERVVEMSDGRRLTVTLPEGVDNGTRIRLAGQGDPGMNGGPNGDLYLVTQVMSHPYFTREGNNLLIKLPITFSEAVLGAEVEVPTMDGRVHMKIPKGVSSGQRLKLSGKGIGTKGTSRGDQFVEVQIKVPKDPPASYKDAATGLQSESFNPREGLF
jgi:curved DNA-binding protein